MLKKILEKRKGDTRDEKVLKIAHFYAYLYTRTRKSSCEENSLGYCENMRFEKMSYVLLCNSARMHVILLYNGILTVPTIYGRAGRESLFLLALV